MENETLIGVHACGCITGALIVRHSTATETRRFYRDMADTGREVRRVEGAVLKGNPDFLPSKCPHTPEGWRHEPPREPDPIRYRRVRSRNISVVDVRIPGWEMGGFRAGEVAKRDGKWWATEGWMDPYEVAATDGRGELGEPSKVLGPFAKQREAAEALLPLAKKRGADLQAEWARQRAERAAA